MTLTLPYWSHASRTTIYRILCVNGSFKFLALALVFVNYLVISQNEDYCLSHRSRGGHFDDKCSRGSNMTLALPYWSHASRTPIFRILCVNGSFKCLALALVFVNEFDNLTE